jgi:16S rRNA A1518/A1519 N6-dimethyltransferase RsmA/KsgA/DIM1 with predicted DNA glycosylase/AP lyase activity
LVLYLLPTRPNLLDQIANGEKRNLKKEFQFFATPEKLADELVYLADLKQHDTILEPSAGQGAIIKAINKVCDVVPDCFELMDVNTVILNKSGLRFNLIGDDFLSTTAKLTARLLQTHHLQKTKILTI